MHKNISAVLDLNEDIVDRIQRKKKKHRKKTERIPGIETPLHRKQIKGIPGQQGISAQRLTGHRECCRTIGHI